MLNDSGFDAIDLWIFGEHIMVREGFELLRTGYHKHLVLLIDPPVLFLPLLVVRVYHLGEKLIFIRFVVGEVPIEGHFDGVSLLLRCSRPKIVPLDDLP